MRRAAAAIGVLLAAVPAAAQPVASEPEDAPSAERKPEPPEPKRVIGLLDVRAEGVSATAAEVFTKEIEQSLEMSGLAVAPRQNLLEYLAGTPWNGACLIGPCLAPLRSHGGVETVVEVALATNGPSYHYVITLLDTATGAPIGQLARKCDVCTTQEAFAAASLAVVELVNGVGEAAPPDPAIATPMVETRRLDRARRRTRFVGIGLVVGAAAAAAGSYFLFRDERDTLGGAAAGAAGALGVAGVTSIGISFAF